MSPLPTKRSNEARRWAMSSSRYRNTECREDHMLRLLTLGLAICTFGFEAAHAQSSMLYSISYIEVGPVLAKVGATTLHAYRDAARKEAASLDVYERID